MRRWMGHLASWTVEHRVEILAMLAGAILASTVLHFLLR